MVDLNAHEAGNGGKKPREAYSSPSLLYSENAALSPTPILASSAFPAERYLDSHLLKFFPDAKVKLMVMHSSPPVRTQHWSVKRTGSALVC